MKRGRKLIGLMLVASLLVTFAMQAFVRGRREVLAPKPRSASHLSGLDTFALGLVLGGLRGPLAMMLWHAIENQKIERNLEDIDTKIELIRMLQAEFMQVHVFQIWNKAYNISVQMASPSNRYAAILDAIDYARSVDAERPDDVHILFALADVYFTKLGTSSDKKSYIAWMREETRPSTRPVQQKGNPGWRRTRHDVMLDQKGLILPVYLQPRIQPRAQFGPDAYNGAELQYLARYNTPEMGGFPYGLPPQAVGYNYYRRADAVMLETKQKHSQMSEAVLDSRPAIALNYWAADEWERAKRLEVEASGRRVPEERGDLEQIVDLRIRDHSDTTRSLIEAALFSYTRTAQVCQHAELEYRRHITNLSFAYNTDQYLSHLAMIGAIKTTAQADHDYLAAAALQAGIQLPSESVTDITQLRARAADLYRKANDDWWMTEMKYGVDDEAALVVYPEVSKRLLGKAIDRSTILQAKQIFPQLLDACAAYYQQHKKDMYADSAGEYKAYIDRTAKRLNDLQSK